MAETSRAKFLSQAEFARARNVSRKTVTGWKQKGLLVLDGDGRIDVEATEWNLDQRPATYRGGVTHRPVRAAPGNTEPAAPAKPKADTWQKLGEAMPRPAQVPADHDGEAVAFDPDDPDLPLPLALQRKENYLGLYRRQEVLKNDKRLVDRVAAEKLFFDTARELRDAWMTWPARVAIEMADELHVDARLLTTILTAHVRKHIAELGEPEPDTSIG